MGGDETGNDWAASFEHRGIEVRIAPLRALGTLVAGAGVGVLLLAAGAALGIPGLQAEEGPEIEPLVELALVADDQTIADVAAANGSLIDPHPLQGGRPTELSESIWGVDTDGDTEYEWICEETRQSRSTRVDRAPSPTGALCQQNVAVLPRGGSDTFLLSDGTVVERIDVDGDGRADFLKVGSEETRPIVRPQPWWQALVGPSVVAAAITAVFAYSQFRVSNRNAATASPQSGRPPIGEGSV